MMMWGKSGKIGARAPFMVRIIDAIFDALIDGVDRLALDSARSPDENEVECASIPLDGAAADLRIMNKHQQKKGTISKLTQMDFNPLIGRISQEEKMPWETWKSLSP